MSARKASRAIRTLLNASTIAAAITAAVASPSDARAVLSAHVPVAVAEHEASLIGHVDAERILYLDIVLPMRNREALKALVGRIYDPSDSLYRHYLSVGQFTERFGPSRDDYDQAVAFFRSSGLEITRLNSNRYMLEAHGRAADIERVFHIRLNIYRHPAENRSFMAPDREPTVNLGVAILHVDGLDDFELPKPRLIRAPEGQRAHGTGSGPNGSFIGSDMRAAYYGGTTLTGAGQSLGLMELVGWNPADIALYFQTVNQPLNVPVNGISVDGKKIHCTHCNDGEQALDIEYAISMAPGLAQVQVYVAHGADAVLEAMASDNTSKQLSTSWGWHNNFVVDDPLFLEMAAQGQSFLTASGDYSNLKQSGPWPEEDANLTGVGGTDLVTVGPGGPYQSEKGWSGSAGGPSLDRSISIEPYQLSFINERNEGSRKVRDVPDVSAHADTDCFICSNGRCSEGWGGTSFASPMWTGFVALINQQAVANGQQPVGFLNPTLYNLAMNRAQYVGMLHDVMRGQSGLYTAVKGFDLVTGLGSPGGQGLINALAPSQ